jgi:hypothetical protein
MGIKFGAHRATLDAGYCRGGDKAAQLTTRGTLGRCRGWVRQSLLACMILLVPGAAGAGERNNGESESVHPEGIEWWWAGVSAFQAGVAARDDAAKARRQFAQAAACWEKLWWEGEQTPALARNRARAHYLAGNLPQALVAIHQGLALAPWDRHLQREWAALREEVAKTCDPKLRPACQPISLGWLRRGCSPWEIWGLVTGLWWGGWLALARFRMVRRGYWGVIAGGLFGGAVLLAAVWEWEQWQWQREECHHPLLILARPTLLRTGNATEYPPYWPSPLPAGVEGRWTGQRGAWVQWQLPDGTRGWVPAADVLWVHPTTLHVGGGRPLQLPGDGIATP